ncbi:MAG: restriction endonuclease subunit S [Lutispora sp.]|nr:restriction endonuclease subunit S [Lutispora sp.]
MNSRDDGELRIENGELDREWREYRLSEIMNIIGGGTPKTTVSEYWNGEIPWLSVKDFNSDNRIVYKTEKSITQLGLENSSTKMLDKGDLIISARGTVGALAQLGKPMAFNQSCYGLRANEVTTNDYLYYLIKYKIRSIQQNTHGSVFDTITRDTFEILTAKLPDDIREQKVITHILSTLDEKIEVNNQINKTLEEMAQSIFKNWFVDFEFPNEDGEPYKSNGGEMVDSEFGMIPKGWKVDLIGNKCACILGGTPSRSKPEFWGGCIPWINSGKVNDFRVLIPSETITDIGLEESATKLLPEKTTLLAITGATLGRVSLLEIDSCTNQSVVGIIENNEMPYSFIYPYIKSIISNIISHQTGGAQQHINKGNIENTAIIIPSNEIMIRYNKINRALYDTIGIKCFENLSLEQLRDTLLPKLMSGEIRVPLENGKLRMEN